MAANDARAAEQTRELEDLRVRHEAVAGVLRAMSRSGMRLQPILDQIVAAAARLCRADSCLLWLADGDLLHVRASYAGTPESIGYARQHPHRAEPTSNTGRVAMTKQPVHIPDVLADPDYKWGAIHYRTLLGVPVLVEDDLVGVIGVSRTEHRPFVDSEIELLVTFADQSSIAIANAELFETVERQRAELARFLSPEIAAVVSSADGEALLAGHRAHISVLFFDLRGFTTFTRDAEPEEVIEVLREYHAVAGELIVKHGGTVEHFAGDGLMVFFNDPVQVAEHELQAARLACAMRQRVGALAAMWDRRGFRLGLGSGLDVGHATLGRIGFEGRYDYAALGTVANLASRLSDEAEHGQIIMSQRALAALDRRVEAEPLPDLRLKGFERPVRAYALLRVIEA